MLQLPGGVVPHIARLSDDEMSESESRDKPAALLRRMQAGELSEQAIARNRAKLLLAAVQADDPALLAQLVPEKKRLGVELFTSLCSAADGHPDAAAWLLEYRRAHYSEQDLAAYETHRFDLELGFAPPTVAELRGVLRLRYTLNGVRVSGYKRAQESYDIPARIGEKRVIAVDAAAFYPLEPLPVLSRQFAEDTGDAASLRDAVPGDTISFGRCVPAPGGEEAPIRWRVLRAEAGRLLVLAEHGVAALPYEPESREVTWETCRLRRWLNGVFLPLAFTKAERAQILAAPVVTPDNAQFGTPGGGETQDRLFLLSAEEAEALTDETARSLGVWWWLRSAGFDNTFAVTVTPDGRLYRLGGFVDAEDYAVRPAMWLRR